jgi:hypothetical protein
MAKSHLHATHPALIARLKRAEVMTFAHMHNNLPLDHPHLQGERHHSHSFIVDDEHPRWASQV